MGRLFICVLISFGFALPAMGYPIPVDVDGELHKWPISLDEPNVFYEVVAQDQTWVGYLESIVDESANIWSAVEGSLLRVKIADENHAPQITIYYDNTITGGESAAGYSIFDSVSNGEPEHCSVHIAVDSGVDAENLSKTTLHELGHCLGLAHSLMPESIMSYNLERNSFALSTDDRAAMSRLYPADGHRERLAPGCAIGTRPSNSMQPAIFIGLLIIPALLPICRISRRMVARK